MMAKTGEIKNLMLFDRAIGKEQIPKKSFLKTFLFWLVRINLVMGEV